MGWLITSRNLFLTVLEAVSPRPGCQQCLCLVRALFWFADSHLPIVSSRHGKRASELSGVSFTRAPDPIHKGSAFMT